MSADTTSTDEKTRRILDAVRHIMAVRGYQATTISMIAAEAGVSRGLLHYYFKNKEDMLGRVIEENLEMSVLLVMNLFEHTRSADELAEGLTTALRDVLREDPDFFNLFFEAWSAARSNQGVYERLKRLYSRFRDAMEEGLEEARRRGTVQPTLPSDGLAAVITGLFDGIGLQMVTEPRLIDNEHIWETTRQVIANMLVGDP